ncbi:MAG: glycosyltransferase family 4 protein [Deltaproteobacteria bacterium]|nr:glycosyltransferase family 4 protein [Deltaproteobacteria bacterium]
MKRIKVLHLVEDLKIGGLERVIASIAEYLDDQKFDVSVWCITKGGEIAEELAEKGIKIEILGIFSYHNPVNILRLVFMLRQVRPNIVHTHGYFASVIGRLAAKIALVPIIIYHVHTIFYDNIKKRNIIIERLLGFITDKIIFISNAAKKSYLPHFKINESKISVIYNGVIDANVNANLKKGNCKVVTVASLVDHKGHEYLLEAAMMVLDRLPQCKFFIVGEGVLNRRLKQQVLSLGIASSVNFLGQKTNIYKILSQMDLFVLPSLREGLGIAAIEAMSCGLPVVASNVGGLPEVVKDGHTGYLVPPKDSVALGNAISQLLENPKQMVKMGQMGRLRFEEIFSSSKMIKNLENLYEYLVYSKK